MTNFLRKTCNRVVLFLLAALITLPLQGLVSFVVSADETGTWIDGDMPELVLGDKLGNPTPPTCFTMSFVYFTHLWPNGTFDKDGHQQPIDVCGQSTGFGDIGNGGGRQYVRPGTQTAFRVASAIGGSTPPIQPLGSTSRFYYAPVIAGSSAAFLGVYDNLPQAGEFGLYNNEIMYRLTTARDHYLKDAAGTELRIFPGTSVSKNGQWMVVQISSTGFARINTATREMLLFTTESYGYQSGLAPTVYTAISDDGNTVIKSGTVDTRLYDLSGCQPAPIIMGSKNNSVVGCRSRLTGPDLRAKHAYFEFLMNMRFNSDGKSIRGTAAVFNPATTGYDFFNATYSVAGYSQPKVTYLALGDSFSSGEGEVGADGFVHYVYGTNTTSPKNLCHTSDRSYPYLVAEALGIVDDFHSVACSGAESRHYLHDAQYDNSPSDFVWLSGEDPQNRFVTEAQPDVITLSMIGNDIGFSDKIQRCLEWVDTCFRFKEDRESIADEIYGKFDTLVDIYEDIQRTSGGARVYVLGYPQLMSATGECGLNTPFDPEEREMARGLVTYLNAVIKAATQRSGVQYVDVENAFAGHQLCEQGSKAVNGLTNGDDMLRGVIPIGNESLHPNSLGHQLFAQALLVQSNNLAKPMPVLKDQNDHVIDVDMTVVPPYVGSAPYLALTGNVPSGGVYRRAAYTVLSGADMIVEGVPFVPEPVKRLLKPTFVSDVVLNSEPVKIGTLATNDQGELVGRIVIPEGTTPGFHTLHIYAQDITGQGIDLNQTVYVAASATDYDGDGILNEDEECLAIEPANEDVDHDGIDDACDPQIGVVPSDSTPPEVIGTPDREPNANGWYNADVSINWTATDPDPSSGAPTQPVVTVADQEGVHTYLSDPSCDPLNNCAAGSLELKIDKTAPTITYSLSTQPSANGWHNSSVTVTFDCTDATSGVAGCSGPETVSGTDGVYVVTGEATDLAGNTSSVNVLVPIDGTAPTVTQSVSPIENANGWHNTDVTVTSVCDDNFSGVLDCSPSATISAEGANQVVESTARDNAGNMATASTNISIDKTAPTLGAATWTSNPKSVLGTATISVPAADNLSGITEAEYYLGDTDPGQGNGATMQVGGGTVSVDFNTDFPTGVYRVTVRAKDAAGNWSAPVADYLVVYDPFGTRMTGKKALAPSLASGDILPGLINANQEDKARFGFNVRYDDHGQIHKQSDFQFTYQTGTKCSKPTQASNCHTFELNATSIAWLTTQGQNDSIGIFQGAARLEVDGVPSSVVFRLTGLDSELLNATSEDRLVLKIYADGTNPNVSNPIYQINAEVLRGNIKIRKW